MSETVPTRLRALVRERAAGRCEYCLLHEDDSFEPHEPDHVIATKHRGRTEEDNLAWTCPVCNCRKGSDVASIDPETGRVVRLFHPRRDAWGKHFRLEGARIIPLTAVRRVTEYLLQLNRGDRVRVRRVLIARGHYPG
jgi:hypothetical protein